MMTYKHARAICIGLAASFWFTVSANGQEAQIAQLNDTSHPATVVTPNDIPWHDLTWVERRYKIEAMRFKARDETGWDWTGSDEVMIETVDPKGSTLSEEIRDIDSGDTHHFDPAKSCIVAVRPGKVVLGRTSVCDEVGEPAPLGFSVEFWEKDLFNIELPDFPSGFSNCAPSPLPGQHSGFSCGANDGSGDDFIGRAQIDLTQQDLDAVLLNVGDEYVETVVLNPCRGADVCDVTWGPDYTFTYRITRLPDAQGGLHGVLDEAMRKIGARSELEAIAAGLRSLRMPSPRKVESEADSMPLTR
ncbi:MAG TPA: hypothetical protein VLE46_09160 [Nitrospira sp.]|nr:hypothetical protein [Nitrospira sp.]